MIRAAGRWSLRLMLAGIFLPLSVPLTNYCWTNWCHIAVAPGNLTLALAAVVWFAPWWWPHVRANAPHWRKVFDEML